MKKSLIATGVAASLAFGAGGCGRTPDRTPDSDLQKAFETTTQFWQGEGINLLGKHATKLVEVHEPRDVYMCPDGVGDGSTKMTPGGQLGLYCGDKDTVIIGGQTYDGEVKKKLVLVEPEDYARWLVGHELGHDIQVKYTRYDGNESLSKELSADCYAGMANATMPLEKTEAIYSDLGDTASTPLDDLHGTKYQRISAFLRGQQVGQHVVGNLQVCSGSAFEQN
jgi:hypothetical protein